MPKDNENIPLVLNGPNIPDRKGFDPDQMVLCDQCLRSNAPTRISCLYCGAALPVTETSASLQKPTLRPPAKSEPGFNIILLAQPQTVPDETVVRNLAEFLKLPDSVFQQLLTSASPVPLARTASEEEANVVAQRMNESGLNVLTVSDRQLGFGDNSVVLLRSIEFNDEHLSFFVRRSSEATHILYDDLVLLVQGRVVTKTTEVTERKSRGRENEILSASEFFADEPFVDLYDVSNPVTWRITATTFDFSCLQDQKALVASQNIPRLVKEIVSRAKRIRLDDRYNIVRQSLNAVWSLDSETKSRGWRRDGPGRLAIEGSTIQNSESQFTRYSKLAFFLQVNRIE